LLHVQFFQRLGDYNIVGIFLFIINMKRKSHSIIIDIINNDKKKYELNLELAGKFCKNIPQS
jgi:hypothetical protein